MAVNLTSEQIVEVARRQTDQFEDFLQRFAEDNDDITFFYYVDALMRKIYVSAKEGRYLTKTQACRMIPAKNATTCIKYVEEARERGFISFVQDEKDKRRFFIHPSDELMSHVERVVSENFREVLELTNGFDIDKILMNNSNKDDEKIGRNTEKKSAVYPVIDFI